MCFYNDYEWTARVQNDDIRTAEEICNCGECGGEIPVGAVYRAIEQVEEEECQRCFGMWAEEDKDACDCAEPDLGEEFRIDICADCNKFLQAIQAAEIAEGCSGEETQPAFGRMIEQISEIADVDRYFAKARELFPELESSGYLSRIAAACGRGVA